jgi:hypothetical protein
MKYLLGVLVFSLIGAVFWLPLELDKCQRLTVELGDNYFCLPLGFIAIPVLSLLLLILAVVFLFKRIRNRKLLQSEC